MQDTHDQHSPYLPLQSIFPPRISDEEYVAGIAKSLQWWDRWRSVAILFHVAVVAGVVWLGFSAVDLIKKFQGMLGNQNRMPEEIVIIGIILGMTVGIHLQKSVLGVIDALTGLRTERLLAQHFNLPSTPAESQFCDHHANTPGNEPRCMTTVPEREFHACMCVLTDAILRARAWAWQDQVPTEQLADLMDAVHNIPTLLENWESCDQDSFMAELNHFQQKWASSGGLALHSIYEQALARPEK